MFMQSAARFVPAETARPAAPPRKGLVASTLIETEAGWRPAGALQRGDRVQTFDGGLREVIALDRDWLLTHDATLIRLPGGLLGAAVVTLLLPDQSLLIDTWDALPDAVVALVPAIATLAIGATLGKPAAPVEVVTPVFAEEEVIRAQGGLLLHCPGAHADDAFYPRLDAARASAILTESATARRA